MQIISEGRQFKNTWRQCKYNCSSLTEDLNENEKKCFLFKIKISYFITIFPSNLNGLGSMVQGRPVRSGGAGGLQPPNNLPKFVDFVGCESQGCRNEDLNSYIFEEATRIYQKCNIF